MTYVKSDPLRDWQYQTSQKYPTQSITWGAKQWIKISLSIQAFHHYSHNSASGENCQQWAMQNQWCINHSQSFPKREDWM